MARTYDYAKLHAGAHTTTVDGDAGEAGEAGEKQLDEHTVAELRAIAEELDLDVPAKATKAELVAAIEDQTEPGA
jgi:hypothetical protein